MQSLESYLLDIFCRYRYFLITTCSLKKKQLGKVNASEYKECCAFTKNLNMQLLSALRLI